MSIIDIVKLAAAILTLSALFGYINHRWLKFPHPIRRVIIMLLASMGTTAVDLPPVPPRSCTCAGAGVLHP